MSAFSPLEALIPSLWWVGYTLVFIVFGMLFYGWLADRAIFEGEGKVNAGLFGRTDVVVAGGLTLLFLLLISTHGGGSNKAPTDSEMIAGVVESSLVFLFLVGGVIGGLLVRQISCREAFGFTRAGFAKIVFLAPVLLLMAYPLIAGALALTRLALAASGYGAESPQEIVQFLGAPGHGTARAVVAISAIILAPFQEELIFRGYIYGVVKRYGGIVAGLLVNATLFAAVHMHIPSFGGLFVLAVCLTLAYEWTGSILVSMTVHALFNALTVISLLTGGGNG